MGELASAGEDGAPATDAEPPEEASGPLPVAHLLDRRGRCRLVYEPIADLARGAICGYEALERFPGALPPERWRTEALRRGLEPDYDAFVIDSILQARESLPDGCFLSFDARPATLLRESVRRVLARAGSLDGLVIELVPRLARRDEPRFAACAAELHERGVRFAVDHVGGEDGVLRFMSVVLPSLAKLDAVLVEDLHALPAKRFLLYELERIATRFGVTLVASGVRRVEELDALARLRVPLVQGPLVGVRAKTLTPVAFALSRYVRERGAALLEPGSLAPLVEPAPGFPLFQPGAVAAAFAARAELRWAVLLDAGGRPVGLHERDAFSRGEPPVGELLTVRPTNAVAEAAQRAMARQPARRFDPLVCCEAGGAYVGVVPCERLVDALAEAVDRAADDPGWG
ncbi:MAG TPA: EAL domain-containing protein [Conexibacter sp.]|nr:EAL domain-containing protein [Conexibacter sp.]